MELFGISLGKKKVADEEIADIDDIPTPEVDYEDEGFETFTYEPTIPTVNTIPDEIIQKYQVKGIVKLFMGVVAAVALLFVLIYIAATFITGAQDNQIKTLNAERDSLQAEMQILQPYEAYKGAVNGKIQSMKAATEGDINYGTLYKDILDASEANDIMLNNIVVAQFDVADGSEVGACVSPDPFNPTDGAIGCVTLQGGANDKDSLISFLNSLEKQQTKNGFKLPSISSFTYVDNPNDGQKPTSFQASIFFTPSFNSDKYKDLNATVDELITPKEQDNTNPEEPGGETEGQATKEMVSIAKAGFKAINISPDDISLAQAANLVTAVCSTPDDIDTSGLPDILEAAGAGDLAANSEIFLNTVKGKC